MFEWKKEYEIGIEKIDTQHKKLFEIADRGYALLKNDLYLDKYDRILDLLNELKDYTQFHFSEEEKYMESIGHKKLFTHKIEHNQFIEKISNVNLKSLDNNQDKYIVEMLDFIVNWIKNHILEKDKEYVNQI